MNFEEYRHKINYSEKTIQTQNHHVKRFLSWCMVQNITPESISYGEALKFIDHERSRSIRSVSISRTLNSIKIYFDYLIVTKAIEYNVIRQVKLRNEGKKALPQLLTAQQLETIYQSFNNLPEWNHKTATAKLLHQRNTVILGLLIYQGLDSGEVAKLETSHINLAEGKIYIPSGRSSNARTLKLQAVQILPFKTYIEETRPKLQEKRNQQTPHLFPSKKYSDMICKIVEQIKKISSELKDSRQIRASVIMSWLKTNNIRQVQYMAGHKSIRSTEQYRNQDLTDLTKQLELFHPMR
jgi:integrase/recombinase XerD